MQTSDTGNDQNASVNKLPVASHVRCLHCDYDLHGVSCDGVCPECGFCVRDSVEMASNAARKRRLLEAAYILLVGHYVLLACGIVFPFLPLGWFIFLGCSFAAAYELGRVSEPTMSQPRIRLLSFWLLVTALLLQLCVALTAWIWPLLAVALWTVSSIGVAAAFRSIWRRFEAAMVRTGGIRAGGWCHLLAVVGAPFMGLSLAALPMILTIGWSGGRWSDWAKAGFVGLIGCWVVLITIGMACIHQGIWMLKRVTIE